MRPPTWAGSPSAGSATGRFAAARPSPGAERTGEIERVRITELYVTEALERVDAEAAAGRRHHLGGRDSRDHDRRDAGRRRGPAAAARDHGRGAEPVGDDRDEHLAARRPGRRQADRQPDQGPAGARAGGQRLAPDNRDRATRRVGGPGPRRAGAGDPGRAHAARGVRADRGQAAGGDAGDRRHALRAGGADERRRSRGLRRRGHPAAGRAQGTDGAHGQPRHRLGADGLPGAGARADRVPDRVPHRDSRHRDRPPRVRPLGAVARRAAHASHRIARGRPPRHRWRRSPCSTSRSAAPCSSAPARTSTRG